MNVHARLNYINDTFLGSIAKSNDCEIVIIPITPGAFQVQVLSQYLMIFTRPIQLRLLGLHSRH